MLKFEWKCKCGHKNISETDSIQLLKNNEYVRCQCKKCGEFKNVTFEIKVED